MKKNTLFLIAMVCLVAGAALAFYAIRTHAGNKTCITILHVNDTHSQLEPVRSGEYAGLGGELERAAYIDSVRRADGPGNVLVLHAGDYFQGSSYFSEFGGNVEIQALNVVKYDAVTLGNHEFDNGLEALGERLSSLECP